MCLFTSPGVYACGYDAKIYFLFPSVPFRGRDGWFWVNFAAKPIIAP